MPPDTGAALQVVDIADALRRWPLPMPDDDSDKEDRGRVVLVAGSRQIPGAAVLAATAALRAGAGRVTIGAPQSIAQAIAIAVPESRVIALRETAAGGIDADTGDALDEFGHKARAVLIGPGLPYDDDTTALASRLLERFSKASVILDAAAMGLARNDARLFVPALLTPHCGEMASLTGARKDSIEAKPADAARRAARAWNAVVALKGAVTYVAAPDGRVWRHEGGNAGLAMSGSGDVLAGIMAGLVARGMPLEGAAAWGVALHGRAGENLARRIGPLGYLARELPAEIPALMASAT